MATVKIKVRIEGELGWRVIEEPENAGWVGVCDALGISVEGATWKEFTEAANEAVDYIVRTHLAEGTLTEFVRKHGWRLSPPLPAEVHPDDVELDVPFDLPRVGVDAAEARIH